MTMSPPPSSSSSSSSSSRSSMLTSTASIGHGAISTNNATLKGNGSGPSFSSSSFLEIGQLQLMDLPTVTSSSSSSSSSSPLGVRFSIVPSIKGGGSSAGGGSSSNDSSDKKSTGGSSSSSKSSSQHREAVPKKQLTAWSGPPTQQQQQKAQQQRQKQSNDGTTRTSFRWGTTGGGTSNLPSSSISSVDGSSSSSTNSWKLVAPLKDLYHSKLKIQVLYPNEDADAASNNASSAITRRNVHQQVSSSTSSTSSSSSIVRYEAELSLRSLCINQLTKKQLTLKMTKAGKKNNKDGRNQQIQKQSSLTTIAGDAISRTSTSTTTKQEATTNGSGGDEEHRGGDDVGVEPTIKFKLMLSGPLRPIVATCLEYFRIYCTGLDHVQDQFFNPVWTEISKQSPIILSTIPVGVGIGSVPIITAAVVVSPVVVGVTILFFPITIPLIVLAILIVSGFVAIVATILATSRPIRTSIFDFINDQQFIQQFVVTSPVYQSLIYDTGDDDAVPNPISILRWYVVPETMWYRLVFSLTIDLIGSMSYLIPVIGESFDGPWGPIQSMLIMALYNQTTPNLKYVSLAEEWLPFTDALPSATIGWFTENMPTLLEEWNDLMEGDSMMNNAGMNFRLSFLMGSGAYDDDDSSSSNSSSSNDSCQGNKKKKSSTSDPIVPPAQKREILREMQNLSGRLSVKSPPPPTKLPPRPTRK